MCDGHQKYGVLTQLPQYSYLSPVISYSVVPPGYGSNNYNSDRAYLGTPYLWFGFLPTNITAFISTRGLQVNGFNISITSVPTALGSQIVLLPGFNEQDYRNVATGDSPFISQLFGHTKPNPSGRRMPKEYFMFLEIEWYLLGAGNTYSTPFNNLCVQTAAIGFR
jgi:hypothetical protein